MPNPIPGELTNGEADTVVAMLAGVPAERVITWAVVPDYYSIEGDQGEK